MDTSTQIWELALQEFLIKHETIINDPNPAQRMKDFRMLKTFIQALLDERECRFEEKIDHIIDHKPYDVHTANN